MKKTIYCEIDFLKVLFERLENKPDPLMEEEWRLVDYARNIITKVLSHEFVSVHFDDEAKYNQLKTGNEYFFKMVKRAESTKGYGEFTCEEYVPLDSKDAPLDAIYFVVAGEDRATPKGILALTPTTINNAELYEDSGEGIEKGQSVTWTGLLSKAHHNCNAILIVDKYISKNKTENLYPILGTFLSESLSKEIPFHISIFMEIPAGTSVKKEHEEILGYLTTIYTGLSIDLTIYKCFLDDFHDRAIITNNMWIGCEGGFDLLKNVKDKLGRKYTTSTKSTKTHLTYPFLNKNWSTSSYVTLINDAKKVKNREGEFEGSKNNRLLG